MPSRSTATAFDLMRRDPADPSLRLRVVAPTDFAPIPMVVASPGMPGPALTS